MKRDMKILVTVTDSKQIGFDTWQDYDTSKEFDEKATIEEINNWIATIVKNRNILDCRLSQLK